MQVSGWGVVRVLPTLRSFPGLDSESSERGQIRAIANDQPRSPRQDSSQAQCRMDLYVRQGKAALILKALAIGVSLSHGQMFARQQKGR